ncbi:DNA-binding response regulator [Cohnella sp. CIP 111063]|uniref:response regulator n=1 Tax=unclassified Cohnella TaxID=2636738 RepID=UPI000B8BB3E1|nr:MULTISPECIES: response regulator [unclassified Cohnella]OXS55823.1 DNA-binding response regulator [Cohnella sp. CIP 111063]PRX67021.1 two-component system response regulator YesN [Cohnella sp. SGD-V74]
MLQVLVVDDERWMAESVKAGLRWEELGIGEVHLAYNVRQAKEAFEERTIDLMICDIEMPQGSGLELLAWVKERYPLTECVFMTCHADFKYAQQAMQLGSIDYLLKPVSTGELEQAVLKATQKIRKETKLLEYSRLGQFWSKHQPLLAERFWLDIIRHAIPSHPEAIRSAADERNIPFAPQMRLVPILIEVQRFHKELSQREIRMIEYALRNSAEETLLNDGGGQMVALEPPRLLLAIVPADEPSGKKGSEPLRQTCEGYIRACNDYFYCDISCYIGEAVYSHQLAAAVQQLTLLSENNVAFANRAFLTSEPRPSARVSLPEMELWPVMLMEDSADKVLAEAEQFLQRSVDREGVDAEALNRFQHNFMQMAYYALKLKGVHAHQLFGDPESVRLTAKSADSVVDMLVWVRHLVAKAVAYAGQGGQSQSIVEKVKAHVAKHLESEDLSRETLANHVFLNPDYLDRLFKKEVGMSVTDYVVRERMQLAKELLAKTNMPIATIAGRAGYANISHFSRRFKKLVGVGPNDYRRQAGGRK